MDTYVPVYYEVQAEQYDGTTESADRIVAQCEGMVRNSGWKAQVLVTESGYQEDGYYELVVETLEGLMRVSKGDYVVRGVNGEYYFCKPDIFEKKHKRLAPVNKFMGSFDNL